MDYDIIIIGAGPAGCSAAMNLTGKGIRTLIIDKDIFPRRKICGGALSERTINKLLSFPEELRIFEKFQDKIDKIESHGLRIYTPFYNELVFNYTSLKNNIPPGYICKRSDFDNFLVSECRSLKDVDVHEDEKVIKVYYTGEICKVKTSKNLYSCNLVVDGGGADPLFSLNRNIIKKDIGVSCHFKSVSGCHNKGIIDMYFLKDLLPGYFWVFKLPDNTVNAGIYTTYKTKKQNKLNLKAKMLNIINNDPVISERFKDSKQLDDIKGWKLPVYNRDNFNKNYLTSKRYLKIGDAAGLIDPITGEGIGNALVSGGFAAKVISDYFRGRTVTNLQDDYFDLLNKKLGKEFKIHSFFRNIFKNAMILEIVFYSIRKFKFFNNIISKKLYKMRKK